MISCHEHKLAWILGWCPPFPPAQGMFLLPRPFEYGKLWFVQTVVVMANVGLSGNKMHNIICARTQKTTHNQFSSGNSETTVAECLKKNGGKMSP